MRYAKEALRFDQQLDLLRERGLAIPDADRGIRWLQGVSYYRLSAYFLPFKDGERFRAGTDFNDVAGLYIFDRKLRLLVLDGIERIEVAIRTAITYEIAHAYGPFGHTDPNNFAPEFEHARFMEDLGAEEARARETFATAFRKKYTSEAHLPVWMANELLSFGAMSKLYGALSPSMKKRIAAEYGVEEPFLRSWLHALSYLRNVCAHHKRLWNRHFAIKPRFPSRSRSWPHQVPDNGHLYAMLVVTRHMLRLASPGCQWRERLWQLLDEHPTVPLDAMRIPADWRGRALWRG